jgi:hypothetical protein
VIKLSRHDDDPCAGAVTTGRFVLLPSAHRKSRDLLRPRSSGTMKPRLSRGFFLADAHDASHFEAGALVPSWALPPWRSGRGFSQR